MKPPAIIGRLTWRISARSDLVEAVAILAGACLLSYIYMPDNNWDLRNYHLYNAFAWLDGRVSRDLFAAGYQSYFNPILDLPYYVLSVQLLPGFPRLVAALSGIPSGFLAWVALRITRITLPATLSQRNWFAIGAAAAGLTGTASVSEIGTTFGDISIAVLVLGGFTLPLTLLRQDRISLGAWIGAVSLAGLLAGVAAGLKPVSCIFAPGAALGIALTAGGMRRFVLTGLFFSLSWTIGFVLAFGPWGLTIYRLFGNPVFPLMNHIFESSWVPPISAMDSRFMPRDVWQTLFYPFFWLRGRPFVVAELGVRDPRFALAYISLGVILIHMVRHRGRSEIVGKPAVALCIFFCVSFIAWEATFSILRYALALEVTSGILITLALLILAGGLPRDIRKERRVMAVTGVVLIVLFAVSSRPGWGRLRQYGAVVFDVQAAPLPDRSAVVFVSTPTAFIAPFLKGNDVIFVGLEDIPIPSRLSEEATRRIQSRSNILAVIHGTQADYDGLTTPFGFRVQKEHCEPIHSANQRDLSICSCERVQDRE